MTPTIPPITDERIADLVARLPPVIVKGGVYRTIVPVNPVNIAFMWGPMPEGDPLNLVAVGFVKTFHNWGYPGLFKPGLSEVYAFISDAVLEQTGATHFLLMHDSEAPLLSRPDKINISGYHSAIVILLRATP